MFQGIQAVALPLVQEFGVHPRDRGPRAGAAAGEPRRLREGRRPARSRACSPRCSCSRSRPSCRSRRCTCTSTGRCCSRWPRWPRCAARASGCASAPSSIPATVPMLFGIIVIPLTFLGCTYYSWTTLSPIRSAASRWLQTLVLVNPLVYVSEGFRAAVTTNDHMALVGDLPGPGRVHRPVPVEGHRRVQAPGPQLIPLAIVLISTTLRGTWTEVPHGRGMARQRRTTCWAASVLIAAGMCVSLTSPASAADGVDEPPQALPLEPPSGEPAAGLPPDPGTKRPILTPMLVAEEPELALGLIVRPLPGDEVSDGSLDIAAAAADADVELRSDLAGDVQEIAFDQPVPLAEAEAAAAELLASGTVASAEPNRMNRATTPPNDEYYAGFQWPLWAITPNSVYGIGIEAAWNVTKGSNTLTVAVLDTGYLPHPDIAGRLVAGYDMITNPFVAGRRRWTRRRRIRRRRLQPCERVRNRQQTVEQLIPRSPRGRDHRRVHRQRGLHRRDRPERTNHGGTSSRAMRRVRYRHRRRHQVGRRATGGRHTHQPESSKGREPQPGSDGRVRWLHPGRDRRRNRCRGDRRRGGRQRQPRPR